MNTSSSNLSAQAGQNGIVTVDKPMGLTSHTVVSRLRRSLGIKKIGHAGTLDPMATGLVVAGVGPMTRFLTYLVGLDKVYLATIRLGASSSTEDADGEISIDAHATAAAQRAQSLAEALQLTPDALQAAIATLTGNIEQVPSAVSAIKVDGKRAYQRVREGETVQLKARPVTIYKFELLSQEPVALNGANVLDLHVRVHCSSGTYIRALARDLGEQLGVGAHLTALRRTAVGPLRVEDAEQLDSLTPAAVHGAANLAKTLYPHLELETAEVQKLIFGQRLKYDEAMRQRILPAVQPASESSEIAACFGDHLVAMLSIRGEGLHPETVFVRELAEVTSTVKESHDG